MSTKSKLEKVNATLDKTNLKLMAIKNAFLRQRWNRIGVNLWA